MFLNKGKWRQGLQLVPDSPSFNVACRLQEPRLWIDVSSLMRELTASTTTTALLRTANACTGARNPKIRTTSINLQTQILSRCSHADIGIVQSCPNSISQRRRYRVRSSLVNLQRASSNLLSLHIGVLCDAP